MSDEEGAHCDPQGFAFGKKLRKNQNQKFDEEPSQLSIYSLNLGGAKSKITEINHRPSTTPFDILCSQESWFDQDVATHEIVHSTDFNITRNDRSITDNTRIKGGGVFTLSRKRFNCEEIRLPSRTTGEFLCTKIATNRSHFYIINVYMPPYERNSRLGMVNELARVMKLFLHQDTNAEIIVLGDFNMSRITWQFDEECPGILSPRDIEYAADESKFIRIMNEFSMSQIVSHPNGRGKFLDLVFVNNIEKTTEFIPEMNDNIDRLSTHHNSLGVNYIIPGAIKTPKRELNFINVNERMFQLQINNTFLPSENRQIAFENVQNYSCQNINARATEFTDKLFAMQLNCTKKSIIKDHQSQSSHPWTKGTQFKRLENNRRKSKRIHQKLSTELTRTALKLANEALYAKYNELKHAPFQQIIQQMGGSMRNFYGYMKAKKVNKSTLPVIMSFQNEKLTGEARIRAINEHLKSAYIVDINPLPTETVLFERELDNIINESHSVQYQALWDDFQDTFTVAEVSKAIEQLNDRKDSGPMQIQAKALKRNVERIAPTLIYIFNLLMKRGTFHESWKRIYIVPIPKRVELTDVANYRGISLQSCLPKILDKLIAARLTHHLGQLIPRSQHGFMAGRSTITNLLEMVDYIGNNFKQSKQTDVVYIDFSRAFDRMSHRGIITKLCKYSTPPEFIKCIASFICNRTYVLKVDGNETDYHHRATSAVPQGSHLGPFLFILYCAEIIETLEGIGTLILQFADDSKLYRTITDRTDMEQLQQAIDNVGRWCDENRIDINGTKTYLVSYTRSPSRKVESSYYIGAEIIKQVGEIRDLGILFDSKLSFIPHARQIEIRAKSMQGAAYRFAREIRHPKAVLTITQTYICPIIEYGSIIWRKGTQTQNNAMERTLRNATRTALKLPFSTRHPAYVSYSEQIQRLHSFSMEEKYIVAAITFVMRCQRMEIDAAVAEKIRNLRVNHGRATRSPLLYNPGNQPIGSPIRRILTITNQNRSNFDFTSTSHTIKRHEAAYKGK